MNKTKRNLAGILAASALTTGCATHGNIDPVRDMGFLGYEQERIISEKCEEDKVLKPFLEEDKSKNKSIEDCISTYKDYYNDGAYMMSKLIEYNHNHGTLGSGIPTPSQYFNPNTTQEQKLDIAGNIYSQMVQTEGGQELFLGYLVKASENMSYVRKEEMKDYFVRKDIFATGVLTAIALSIGNNGSSGGGDSGKSMGNGSQGLNGGSGFNP